MNIKIFNTPADAAKGLAERFAQIINSINSRNINIAISGGNTPRDFFQLLSTEYQSKITWENVNLFWVDERCVLPDHPESNYGMTLKYLLKYVPIPKNNINRISGENNPNIEAERYSDLIKSKLPKKNNLPYFNIILLGIGDDGHTASIFPDNLKLINSEKICETSKHPVSGQSRITITGKTINNAGHIFFLVTGKNKAKII